LSSFSQQKQQQEYEQLEKQQRPIEKGNTTNALPIIITNP
jgi:hypothetical protein